MLVKYVFTMHIITMIITVVVWRCSYLMCGEQWLDCGHNKMLQSSVTSWDLRVSLISSLLRKHSFKPVPRGLGFEEFV